MKTRTPSFNLSLAGIALALDLVASAQTIQSPSGSSRPPGTDACAEQLPGESMRMYKDANFRGDSISIDSTQSPAAGVLQEVPKGQRGSLSSLRWNLPPGVVVTFYEDTPGSGRTFTIWGTGQANRLSKWNFNDRAKAWVWYYVGGSELPSARAQPAPTLGAR